MGTTTTRGAPRAAKTIGRFAPIKERLEVKDPFDFEAQALPSPSAAYLESLDSADSRRNMGYALDIFAAFLSGGTIGRDEIPWHTLTPEHRDALRAHLVERYQEKGRRGRKRANPESVNNRLTAWRQVLKHAWDKGLMTSEDYQRAANVKIVKGKRQQKRKFIPKEHLAAVFRHCALDPNRAAGSRDAALLALLFGCGLRRAEAIEFDLADLDRRPDGWEIAIVGKRNKERTVGVPIGTAAFIRDWLVLRGDQPGPLFYPIRKNGVIVPQERPMTVVVGNRIVDRRFLAAAVPKFSPHDLRSTSTTILAGLLDLFQTMDWAGHDDANTTRGYVIAANNAARTIAENLEVPHFEDTGRTSALSWEDLE